MQSIDPIKMHGARRVIIFCLLTAVLPTILLIIPLYLRHNLFADVIYSVAESDVLEIRDGISTIFCQDHTLKMNNTFNAYQLDSKPEISNIRKHIRLKKSMILPDDTLEYWGFFLPNGSIVRLSVCSRFNGARLLVVKGEKNLKTCGLLDHTKSSDVSPILAKERGRVFVTLETHAQEMTPNNTESFMAEIASLLENGTDESENNPNAPGRKGRSIQWKEAEEGDLNDAGEVEYTENMKVFLRAKEFARSYLKRESNGDLRTFEETVLGRRLRHSRSRAGSGKDEETKFGLSNEIIEERIKSKTRKKREVVFKSAHNLDAKVAHGGNAINFREETEETSASSFETSLLNCYDGSIFLSHSVPPSELCTNVSFLSTAGAKRMTTAHDVIADGYYYYIFYSDNDYVQNNIHAVFDIFKPTYQYANVSKNCINQTECTFSVNFLSNEIVIVEIPTRDGIEYEDDATFLRSVCEPRMSIYIIFPILVLFLILGCAFL
ncbi:UNVERIFIED_CONTAM: hypothetical protein PYX00_006865 [Menopon gallinae]|uniref:E3 ubiquitin-protein ligase APD1-4 middle domain-containing protein n=1 Tax=Menopon gallinae TaxID=328185 RepID=A0AAW2HYG6_9NEOP